MVVNMLFFISKFFFIFIISFSNANAVEKKWVKKGKYNDWQVFAKSDKVICYTIARPKKMEGEYNFRGRVDAMVAINNNSSENKYYVGLDFGYYFASDEKVKLTIDNSVIFEMDTFAQTAWINPSKNPRLHIKIIEAMKKGNILVAEGISNRGTETKDTYSLVGFTKAFKKVKDVCN